MTTKELINKLKKMPQNIPVFVESYNTDTGKWANHDVDFITYHYHENGINECVMMLNYDNPKCGIIKDNGEYMTDEEMKNYFNKIRVPIVPLVPDDKNTFSMDKMFLFGKI